jgi:hypothetical protein
MSRSGLPNRNFRNQVFFFKSGVFQEKFFSKTGEKSGDLF